VSGVGSLPVKTRDRYAAVFVRSCASRFNLQIEVVETNEGNEQGTVLRGVVQSVTSKTMWRWKKWIFCYWQWATASIRHYAFVLDRRRIWTCG
jgi:hypothetical protein